MVVVKSRRREPHAAITCPLCKVEIEYLKPSETPFSIECAACNGTFTPASTSTAGSRKVGGRRMGTDAKPLETEYYDILGVKPDATLQEIKSAYRRLAIKLHPDKNPNDPSAEEKFKLLAIAYNTLSDPTTRKRYNEMGSKKDAENDVVDPEAVFSTLFGGERFADIIGTISLGADMKTALQEADDEDSSGTASKPKSKKDMTPEEKAAKEKKEAEASAQRAAVREERVTKLANNLLRKLSLYSEQAQSEHDEDLKQTVRAIWEIEAGELREESYGAELLHVVGAVYAAKSAYYLSSTSTPFGLGGWFHSAKNSAHVISETYGTLKAALEVKSAFEEIAKAEKGEGGLTEEKRKELEEKAASKGMRALFLGSKLEVEGVLRDVCDRVLGGAGLDRESVRKRAVGLGIMGEVYLAVKRDPGAPDPLGLESGYVKVDPARPTRPSSAGPSTSAATPASAAGVGPGYSARFGRPGFGGAPPPPPRPRPTSATAGTGPWSPGSSGVSYETYDRRR